MCMRLANVSCDHQKTALYLKYLASLFDRRALGYFFCNITFLLSMCIHGNYKVLS